MLSMPVFVVYRARALFQNGIVSIRISDIVHYHAGTVSRNNRRSQPSSCRNFVREKSVSAKSFLYLLVPYSKHSFKTSRIICTVGITLTSRYCLDCIGEVVHEYTYPRSFQNLNVNKTLERKS